MLLPIPYLLKAPSFYRLKITDKNGSFKYSPVLLIINRKDIPTGVFPNPAIGNIVINHTKAIKGATIKILNSAGRLIMVYTVGPDTTQTSLPVNDLLNGIYLLVFESNGEKTINKLVKQ